MEDSEVLNNPETNVIPEGKPQADVAPAPEVLQQDTGTLYKSARGGSTVTSPVGEKDHSADIAKNTLSSAEAQQTFNYTSQADKDYDESVNTKTTMSNGSVLEGSFQANYGMGDQYKAKEGEDYRWNKQAAEMAELAYKQEEGQARYESIQAKQELDKNAASAFNNYFASEYSARQTQDKMGWTGGQKTVSDLQVAFLQAETSANMYTQTEMQKYGVDTKLGIARMYAEAEQNALALQYYQDAVNLAVQEANETGCYVSAEAREMFNQDKVADRILNDPNASYDERKRAEQVKANTQAYYDSLGFQHWDVTDPKTGEVVTQYYGIQTLQHLTYEETVRNNKVNEDLQRQANEISQQGVNATWASIRVAEKQLEATIAQTNAINSKTIVQEGKQTYSSSDSNYYETVDSKGKVTKHSVNDATNLVKDPEGRGNAMYKYQGNYYVMDSEGNTYKVYNSDESHATEHSTTYNTINNYKE